MCVCVCVCARAHACVCARGGYIYIYIYTERKGGIHKYNNRSYRFAHHNILRVLLTCLYVHKHISIILMEYLNG